MEKKFVWSEKMEGAAVRVSCDLSGHYTGGYQCHVFKRRIR